MARRAMATTFEVVVPFGTPAALDLGEAALDRIDELEAQLTVYPAIPARSAAAIASRRTRPSRSRRACSIFYVRPNVSARRRKERSILPPGP